MSDDETSSDSDSGIRFKTQSVRTIESKNVILKTYGDSYITTKESHENRSLKDRPYGPSKYDSKDIQIKSTRHEAETKIKKSESSYGSSLPSASSDSQLYGPSLPIKNQLLTDNGPLEKSKIKQVRSSHGSRPTSDSYGPAVPEKLSTFGPAVPHSLELDPIQSDSDDETIGPLPPNSKVKHDSEAYGPAIPQNSSRVFGPSIPDSIQLDPIQSDSDDETIGPLPSDLITSNSKAKQIQDELEYRALQLKMKAGESSDDQKVREEWMIELPRVNQVTQTLGPRQFRTKQAPDLSDRSSWTDTPETKKEKKSKKRDLREEAEQVEKRKYDMEQEKIIKKYKKDKKSLVEIHRSKKEKKESGVSERRPFDRDVDLQLTKVDPKKKKALMKGTSLLDSKFSAGETKFL